MRPGLVLLCLLGVGLGASLEKRPEPCKCPPLMTGAFTLATHDEKLWYFSPFEYDALQERLRVYRVGTFQNQSFTYDALLLYTEEVMYEIDDKTSMCTKRPLKTGFQPSGVPADATLVGQYVIGGSSGPGEGLLVNTWTGQAADGAQYMMTMTEYGCFPVSTVYKTQEYGWATASFINGVKGIVDPNALNPPPFCPGRGARPEGKPVDFFSLFKNVPKHAARED